MNILAVSTSAKHPSAAVYIEDVADNDSKESGRIVYLVDESAKPHSVVLCSLVDAALDKAGISLLEIDEFAVDIGPGSFTGVRIGVSFINALAYATNKPVNAIPSLAALRNFGSDKETVCVMLDARNGNGYAAIYDKGKCVMEPCACVQSEIISSIPDNALFIGDAFDPNHECDAALVIMETLRTDEYSSRAAVPMYLRSSQAERMRGNK